MKNKIILALSILGLILGNSIESKNIIPPKEPVTEQNSEFISDIVYSLYAVPDIKQPIIKEDKKKPQYEIVEKYAVPDIEPPANDDKEEEIFEIIPPPTNEALLKYAVPNHRDYSVKKYAVFNINKQIYADKDEIRPGLSEEEFLKLLNKKYKNKTDKLK